MYLLLIGVHAVFFFIAYLFSSVLLQWVFIVLLIFFLLYFSPLFFSKSSEVDTKWLQIPDLNISPKKSILIPLILTYIGIYVLAFTVTRDLWANFQLHIYILLLIFLIFGGYIFAFNWDTIFFRDALRFHLICSYITIFAQLIYFFIFLGDVILIHIIFSIITLIFSYFFFTYFHDENVNIFLAGVLSLIISIDTCIVFLFGDLHIFTLLWITGIICIMLFEFTPKFTIFSNYIESIRIFLLTLLLFLATIQIVAVFFPYFYFVWFLPIFALALFSIHIRYSNYISYSLAILIIFFLYTYLFYWLIEWPDLFSSLLFIF